jgi:hypothetical protein
MRARNSFTAIWYSPLVYFSKEELLNKLSLTWGRPEVLSVAPFVQISFWGLTWAFLYVVIANKLYSTFRKEYLLEGLALFFFLTARLHTDRRDTWWLKLCYFTLLLDTAQIEVNAWVTSALFPHYLTGSVQSGSGIACSFSLFPY